MKILNLDKIGTKEKRQLVIAGKTYAIEEMTVGNYVETTNAAAKLAENDSIAAQVKATGEMILRSIPTMTSDVLDGMSLEHLQTVVAFVRGDDVDGVEQTQEGAPAGN